MRAGRDQRDKRGPRGRRGAQQGTQVRRVSPEGLDPRVLSERLVLMGPQALLDPKA
jgi:hypothetical protein